MSSEGSPATEQKTEGKYNSSWLRCEEGLSTCASGTPKMDHMKFESNQLGSFQPAEGAGRQTELSWAGPAALPCPACLLRCGKRRRSLRSCLHLPLLPAPGPTSHPSHLPSALPPARCPPAPRLNPRPTQHTNTHAPPIHPQHLGGQFLPIQNQSTKPTKNSSPWAGATGNSHAKHAI